MKPRVLLIEDEPGLALTLGDRLRGAGFALEATASGVEGLARARAAPGYDVVLLDLMLPDLDGLEVCRALRRARVRTPILILSARGAVPERVAGLRLGADDYLVKPFDPAELVARVEALLRRASAPAARRAPVAFGDVEVDLDARAVRRGGAEVALGALEFGLLAYLVEREGRVVGRDELLREVWGFPRPPRTRTVDVHLTWLRRKLEPDRARPRFLCTVRGVGYKFVR